MRRWPRTTTTPARARELAACGDGIVRADVSWGQDGFEQCDDGNAVAVDACTNACRCRCGDGLVRQDKGESELGLRLAMTAASDADVFDDLPAGFMR